MKKIVFLLTTLCLLSICVFSCGEKEDTGKDPEPSPVPEPTPTQTVKYLSASEFVSTSWEGSDSNDKAVKLTVNSTSQLIIDYYEAQTISKKTDGSFQKVSVKVSYSFDEAEGSFLGKGENEKSYSGVLTSMSQLKLQMPAGEVLLNKK